MLNANAKAYLHVIHSQLLFELLHRVEAFWFIAQLVSSRSAYTRWENSTLFLELRADTSLAVWSWPSRHRRYSNGKWDLPGRVHNRKPDQAGARSELPFI